MESLKNNAVCRENRIQKLYPKQLLTYEQALKRALDVIEEDKVPSSWKDAMGYSHLSPDLSIYVNVPSYGVIQEIIRIPFSCSLENVENEVWSLGGDKGWLFMNWAWNCGFFRQTRRWNRPSARPEKSNRYSSGRCVGFLEGCGC